VVAAGPEDFRARLIALADDRPAPGLAVGTGSAPGPLAVLFTGQGSQRPGMGGELYGRFAVFTETFDAVVGELDHHLAADPGSSVRDIVLNRDDRSQALLNRTVYTQAGLFALEVALFRQYESWGMTPDLLAGHSIGELSAAHVSGVWSLPDAASVVAARGRLMDSLPTGGAMAAIQAEEAEILALIGDGDGAVGLAAINGPRSVVVSGDADAVEKLTAEFAGKGRRTRVLKVSHAFHSARMDPILDEFRAVVARVTTGDPKIAVISDLTGRPATSAELGDPDYWVRHLRNPVRFQDVLTHLSETGVNRYLELGPDGVLTALAQESAPDGPKPAFAVALRRDRPEAETLLTAAGQLFDPGPGAP
jgi:acyl transferase domain-containing protein